MAEVLDPGSEPVAEAKKKHKHKKKKKKKKRPPAFNVVQCPTEENGIACQGTTANDFLIGGPEYREPFGAFDVIFGGEGNDVYNGGNGSDNLDDSSTTSSDVYLFPVTEFSAEGEFDEVKFAEVRDEGGSGDIVGLNSYSIDDFLVFQIVGDDSLFLDGPGIGASPSTISSVRARSSPSYSARVSSRRSRSPAVPRRPPPKSRPR